MVRSIARSDASRRMRPRYQMFSLPPRQGERDGPDIAAAFGADRDGLPVAMRRHRQIGRKALAVRRYFNVIARRAALERAGGVAAGLGPLAGNGAAAIFHVAREVEIIAGAGASEIEVELGAAFVDVVGRAAAQRLLLAVGHADRAAARPGARHDAEPPHPGGGRGSR